LLILKTPTSNPFLRPGNVGLMIKLVVLSLLVVLAFVFGREFAHHIPTIEHWISSHGWLGPVVFVAGAVLLTSVFVPDTVFAVIAGALFGVVGGTLVMILACYGTASLNFTLSRRFLHDTVCRSLAGRPRLAAIHRAVAAEGVRFQFLLRLTPLNPVAVNYVLGASGTSFPTFLAACAGMIPLLGVEVYFGHAASHLAVVAGGVEQHSTAHTVLTLGGLGLCVGLLTHLTRIAKKALAAYETQPAITPAPPARAGQPEPAAPAKNPD
jgi:uncharacterized membrane protein YdjX (TVP38/TMEM64 family)